MIVRLGLISDHSSDDDMSEKARVDLFLPLQIGVWRGFFGHHVMQYSSAGQFLQIIRDVNYKIGRVGGGTAG